MGLTKKCYFITMHFDMKILKYFVNGIALIIGLAARESAAEPKEVASIYPLHALAAGVMAGVGTPMMRDAVARFRDT